MKKILLKLSILGFVLSGCSITNNENTNDSNESSYTVSFNTNGGNFISPQTINEGQKIEKPNDPVRTGYTFLNWTLNGLEWDFNTNTVSENISLDANWKIISYHITYNVNGGINDEQNVSTYTINDNVTFYEPTKIGYTFLGWFDNNGKQFTNLNGETYGDLFLNALWNNGNEYHVLLNANGGSINENSLSFYYGNHYSIEIPSKTGYKFIGWHDGNSFIESSGIWTYLEDKELTARWELEEYEIHYHLDGGTNNIQNPSSFTIEDNFIFVSPTKVGYTFIKWTTDNNKEISSSDDLPASNLELYANWNNGDQFTLYFDTDGGDIYQTSEIVTYNQPYDLYEPYKEGYTFDGWYDWYENDTKFEKTDVWNFLEDKLLLAHWIPNTYKIIYDLDGGVNNPSNPSNYVVGESFDFFEPTKSGNEFIKWVNSANKEIKGITSETVFDVEIKACWKEIEYEISYNLNGGINSGQNLSFYTISTERILYEPTKDGYTFLGWFDKDNKKIEKIERGSTGNIEVFAKWNDGNKYVLTLNANGGIVTSETKSVQYDHTYTLEEPSKTGYTFNGWFDGEIQFPNSGTWTYSENKELTAHWSINTYTITYILNDGINNSLNPSSYNVLSDGKLYEPTRIGYTFDGWFDEKDNKVEKLNLTYPSNIILYANWIPNKNNLLISSEDETKGTTIIKTGSGYTNELITILATPTENYLFKGWYNGNSKVSDSQEFTFIMPPNNYSLIGKFYTQEEKILEDELDIKYARKPIFMEDNLIKYGLYPQTVVENEIIISELNKLTTPEENNYYLYNGEYYAKTTAKLCKLYGSITFQNGEEIIDNKTYWFKCEPIVWRIYKTKDNVFSLYTKAIIDSHRYNEAYLKHFDESYDHYANNYEYSEIRNWLNNEFYDNAFNLGNDYIQMLEIKNDETTTNNPRNAFVCNDTFDKVFLPSFKEIYEHYSQDTGILSEDVEVTDWAKARGIEYFTSFGCEKYHSGYWTRSPSDVNEDGAWAAYIMLDQVDLGAYSVGKTEQGVRPCLNLKYPI